MTRAAISVSIVIAFVAGTAQAQTQCKVIGNHNTCTDADGNRSTTHRAEKRSVTTHGDGRSSSPQQIGNQRIAADQQQPQFLGQPAPLPQSVIPAHGQRKSFATILQNLSDNASTAFGGPTTAQMQQQHQLELQAAELDNQTRQQNIAQTGLATQQSANQIVGGFARGLQRLQKAGSNLDIVGPVLAQQMGIPTQQAAVIIAQAKNDQNFLVALSENANTYPSNSESATTRQIGNQRVTNFSNGESATTRKIGNRTVTRYSDGRTVICQNIGSQRVCNW